MKCFVFLLITAWLVPMAQSQKFEQVVESSKVVSTEGKVAIKQALRKISMLRTEYQKKISVLNNEFKQDAEDVVKTFVIEIEKAKGVSTNADQLDEAVRLRDLSEKLDGFQITPTLDFSEFAGSWVWYRSPSQPKGKGVQLKITRRGTIDCLERDTYSRTRKLEGRLVRYGESEIAVMLPDSEQHLQVVLSGSRLVELITLANNQIETRIFTKTRN